MPHASARRAWCCGSADTKGPIINAAPRSPGAAPDDRRPRGGGALLARVPARLREERTVLVALLLWCAGIALVDWAVAGSAVLIGFLATGPVIGAAVARVRTTAIVAGWAVALAVALGVPDDILGTTDHAIRVTVVATMGLLCIWIAATRALVEQARGRDRLIADAGTAMSSALDPEVTLIELARLCAARMADWCFVFVREEDGSIRQVAAAHADPDRQKVAWDLLMRYPLDPDRPEGPAKAIRTGESELLPEIGDELLRAIAPDEENLRMLRALELRSAMVTPLVARGRILGAIAFASTDAVFGPGDLALAEELSARAAMTVDNTRLYGRLSATEKELRRSRDQLRAILDGVADAVTAQDASGRLVYANDAAARQLGLRSAGELIEADMSRILAKYELTDPSGEPFPYDDLPGRRALRGENPEPALVLYRNVETGESRWSQIKATAIRDEDGRAVFAINVVEDVTEHREREERQRFLADASGALAASLDVEETFPRVAALAARQIGDWCAIVANEGGALRTLAVAHADPEQRPVAEEMMRRYPLATFGPAYVDGALVEGRSELVPELTDERLRAVARDPEHLAVLRGLRPRSAMAVPMTVRGRVLGAIWLMTAESGRRLDEEDLLLVEELAGRCALALDNARLYEERSRIARTLQESLLPPLLPEVPGLDVAARFRAAGAGIEVGGDFYDLFELGDAGWAVAIGDVCGKGTGAAAVTALARYTVRAAAMRHEDPSQILGLLNDALLTQSSDRRFCTVLYGRVESNGAGVSFEFSSGGHPLPLLLRTGDGGTELGEPGTLLGIVTDPTLRDEEVKLRPGDAVVLYTDGVTEAGAPARLLTGPQLAATVGPPAGLAADAIAERLLTTALESTPDEPRDDIAIIVLKVPEA